MSVVGTFPGFAEARRRTIPAPRNSQDKCTIVSIYPKAIHETKPTIQPGVFDIPPGTYETPSLLVVGSSSWWREIDEEQPLLEIPNSSIQVAESVVNDWVRGLLGVNMSNAMPGLFYIQGDLRLGEIRKEHQHLLDAAKVKQEKWYSNLVRMADILWSRTNGNPLTISEDMRLAARHLAFDSKDWMQDFTALEQVRCYACGNLRNPKFPVCASCKAIDPNHPSAKDIKFAL